MMSVIAQRNRHVHVPDIKALADTLTRFEITNLSHMPKEGIPFFPTHTRFYHMPADRSDDPVVMFQILMSERSKNEAVKLHQPGRMRS